MEGNTSLRRSEEELWRHRPPLKGLDQIASRPTIRPSRKTCGQAGHDCNERYRRHRRILNAMFTEAGPDSDHRLGKDLTNVKAGSLDDDS